MADKKKRSLDQFDRGCAAAEAILGQRRELNLVGVAADVRSRGLLVAEGDSWFDYPFYDVLVALQDRFHWEISSVAHAGDRLECMAYDPPQPAALCRQLEWISNRKITPAAVLLSGGGNDLAGPECAMLLEHAGSQSPGLNSSILNEVVHNRLKNALEYLLGIISCFCKDKFATRIPIIVHGYDYPVPDGRGFLGGWGPLPGPWMSPSFARKAIDKMSQRKDIAAKIVDEYNVMIQELTHNPKYENLVYVDLRHTLSTGANYKDWWANELHPTEEGFTAVARKIAAAIDHFHSTHKSSAPLQPRRESGQ